MNTHIAYTIFEIQGHGPSPSKNSGLAKFLTSGVKEKLAG